MRNLGEWREPETEESSLRNPRSLYGAAPNCRATGERTLSASSRKMDPFRSPARRAESVLGAFSRRAQLHRATSYKRSVNYGRVTAVVDQRTEFSNAVRALVRDILAPCVCCCQLFQIYALFPDVTPRSVCGTCRPFARTIRVDLRQFYAEVPMDALQSMRIRRRIREYPDMMRCPSWRVALRACAFAWQHRAEEDAMPAPGSLLDKGPRRGRLIFERHLSLPSHPKPIWKP